MKQLLSTPLIIFVVGNLLCYLIYLAPLNIYTSAIPVLAIDTTSDDLLALDITEESILTTEQIFQSDNKSLVFVGDIMLARHVEYLMQVNGYDYPFARSGFLTTEPAHLIGNFEASIPVKHKKTPNYNFQFSVNQDNLKGLAEAGFTHLSLANNHTLDYGIDGYKNSVAVLAEAGFSTFGQPKSLGENTVTYISASNTTYALIGLNETQMDIEKDFLLPYLEEAKAQSDVQIAYIHWGEEYTHKPSATQKTIARMLSEAGVDIIIGHHPHVIQSIEKIGDTLVFYSLGNYIFDQYFSGDVMEGLAIRLTTSNNKLKVTLLPHSSAKSHAQPNLMTGQERDVILAEIADYSEENMAEMILAGEVFTPLSLATSTEIAIMNP